MQELSLSVCGDGWFNLCSLITQRETGVQPPPAPESNQTRPLRLLKPAIAHTHSHWVHVLLNDDVGFIFEGEDGQQTDCSG